MEYNCEKIHNVVNSTIAELENLSTLIIPLTYSEEADRNRLRVKKSLLDLRFYLKSLELETRPATTDADYCTEKYLSECDKYSM